MAGRVLVKERVEEHHAAVADGAVVGHERALAEHRRALVHTDELLQRGLVLRRVYFYGAAVFKADAEVLYQHALEGERARGIDDALRLAGLRRDEHLLAGDVGVGEDAVYLYALAAADELRLRYQAHTEIRAVGGLVFECDKAEGV